MPCAGLDIGSSVPVRKVQLCGTLRDSRDRNSNGRINRELTIPGFLPRLGLFNCQCRSLSKIGAVAPRNESNISINLALHS